MKKYLSLIIVLFSLALSAQDTHYSQFFNSPLTLNPALTGLTKGAVRLGAIYRNQWFSGINSPSSTSFFNSPYQTPSFFVDAPIHLRRDAIGIGGLFLYDRAGAGSFGTFQGMISASYIKSMGRRDNHQLSAGIQVGYTQLRLNQNDLKWANQYNGANQFDGNTASNVSLQPNVGYVNFNAGLLYYGKFSERFSMYLGGAFYNAATMKYNLEANSTKRNLYYRYNFQAGLDIGFGKFHLLPSGLFMQQAKADQLNTGLGFGFDFTETTNMTIGLYNRANNITNKDGQSESIIPYAGFEVNGFKLAASYDVTLSRRKEVGKGVGALEISLMYIIMPKALNIKKIMYCPRF